MLASIDPSPVLNCLVVIPCHNEARAIAQLIPAVRDYLPHVLVVDDASTDATAALAKSAGAEILSLASNQGKGAAVHAGLRLAKDRGYRWVLLMDGDGQHAPEDIPALLAAAAIEDRRVQIIGNRMPAARAMPFVRRVTNRVMSAVLSALNGTTLPDTQCGFRLLRLDDLSPVSTTCTRFEIESELLLTSLAAGAPVVFVPVQCRYHDSPSKIRPLRDTLRWCRWLWRSRARFAQARQALSNPLASNATAPEAFSLTKTEYVESASSPPPARSLLRRSLGLLRRIAFFVLMAFVMGAAMDWSARRSRPDQPAGFWWGMLHGALMPAALPTLFFGKDVTIYAPHNRGIPYKLGYTMGVNGCGALFFGMAFWKPRKPSPAGS